MNMFSTSRSVGWNHFPQRSCFCTYHSFSNPQVNKHISPPPSTNVFHCANNRSFIFAAAQTATENRLHAASPVRIDGENESDRSFRDGKLRALPSQAITATLSRIIVLLLCSCCCRCRCCCVCTSCSPCPALLELSSLVIRPRTSEQQELAEGLMAV